MLAKTKAASIPTHSKLVTCTFDEQLPAVFKKLNSNKIHSMPVLDKNGEFMGIVDILDVVKFMVELVGEATLTRADFEFEGLQDFQLCQVSSIMKAPYDPVTKDNPFHPVSEEQSLLSAMEILGAGAHRVPILDLKHQVTKIVSQSAVVRFLKENKKVIGEKLNMPINFLPAAHQFVLSVRETATAIDAFRLMKITGLSTVAVVDNHGRLTGTISAHDLKQITSTARWIGALFKNLASFILFKKASLPISVTTKTTLGRVIDILVEEHIHHVYVCDDKLVPIGVIALTDVIHELLQKSVKPEKSLE